MKAIRISQKLQCNHNMAFSGVLEKPVASNEAELKVARAAIRRAAKHETPAAHVRPTQLSYTG